MRYKLNIPTAINGDVQLPASKSLSNRALIIYALSQEGIMPEGLAHCDDTDVMKAALKSTKKEIDIKAAGTAMRFLTAYLSITPGERVITGTERMQNRPIHILVDALRSLGADIEYMNKEGYPPLLIRGKELSGSHLELKGDTSSQFITALLLIAPKLPNGLKIELKGEVISKPYINMTIDLMNQFGANAKWASPTQLMVKPQPYKSRPIKIEPDWSAASYWFEWVALSKNATILLKDLKLPSLQGDSKGADLFKQLGVHYSVSEQGVELTKSKPNVEKLEIDFIEIPDLAQTFVVTAALLDIPFHFKGLQSLRIKETDRIKALQCEMKKLGYVIEDIGDKELYWDGSRCEALQSPLIKTYEDHRMAMAFAPAAIYHSEMVIDEPLVVTKSYPYYWDDLKDKGVDVLKITKEG